MVRSLEVWGEGGGNVRGGGRVEAGGLRSLWGGIVEKGRAFGLELDWGWCWCWCWGVLGGRMEMDLGVRIGRKLLRSVLVVLIAFA